MAKEALIEKKLTTLTELTKRNARSLSAITTQVTRLDDRMEAGFAALADDVDEMRSTVAGANQTVLTMMLDVRSVRSEVRSLHADLERLTERVDNITGYRKEIDHALSRVRAIEKHLGINKDIAA